MNWEELLDTCTKEYEEHLSKLKDSMQVLKSDKAISLGSYTEENAPDHIKDKVNRDWSNWYEKWGPYGSKARALVEKHQNQIYKNVRQQQITNDLTSDIDKSNKKSKEKDGGR